MKYIGVVELDGKVLCVCHMATLEAAQAFVTEQYNDYRKRCRLSDLGTVTWHFDAPSKVYTARLHPEDTARLLILA